MSKKFNYVFTTGGIGPTHDDITSISIAKAFKVKYGINKKAYSILERYYGKDKFNDGRKKMSKIPAGSSLVLNPSSAAPGFKIKNVICLPGVPSILKSMVPNLKKYLVKGSVIISRSINLNTVESYIAIELEALQNKFLNKVEIGSYPFFKLGRVGVAVVLRSANRTYLKLCEKQLKKIVKDKKIITLNK